MVSGMKNARNATLLLALCLTFGIAGNAVSQPSRGDAFDVSRGVIVTSTSGVRSGSVIEDIFGAEMSIIEPGTSVFSDAGAANSIHVVEWTTPAPVAISVINVFAHHDSPADNQYPRSFDRFVLMAHNVDGDFVLLDLRMPRPLSVGGSFRHASDFRAGSAGARRSFYCDVRAA
jgi:hypothetical protein